MPSQPSLLLTAATAQLLGAILAATAVQLIYPPLWSYPIALAIAQGIGAALGSHKLGAPGWWIPIHLIFTPLLLWGRELSIAPSWYLAAFLFLLLIFWRTDQSRVPLYLSNHDTALAFSKLLPELPCTVIDLGCGNGQFLKQTALLRPDCSFLGIEHAPLTWLWARINTRNLANVRIYFGNFWEIDLIDFQTVYAFLSPVPMTKLWSKVQLEMKPGSQLISNSFPVPDTPPTRITTVADHRQTRLYTYRTTSGE